MVNLGGRGLKFKSSTASVAGSVKGTGTEPPKSIVEHEVPKMSAKDATAAKRYLVVMGRRY